VARSVVPAGHSKLPTSNTKINDPIARHPTRRPANLPRAFTGSLISVLVLPVTWRVVSMALSCATTQEREIFSADRSTGGSDGEKYRSPRCDA
jgi:hypothetical protein